MDYFGNRGATTNVAEQGQWDCSAFAGFPPERRERDCGWLPECGRRRTMSEPEVSKVPSRSAVGGGNSPKKFGNGPEGDASERICPQGSAYDISAPHDCHLEKLSAAGAESYP